MASLVTHSTKFENIKLVLYKTRKIKRKKPTLLSDGLYKFVKWMQNVS